MGVTITKDRVDAVIALVNGLADKRVLVGIPAETALRQPEPGEKGPPPNNAMLGYIHEFGSPAANIPPRPFLIPGVMDARERIGDLYESAARAIIAGRAVSVDEAHARVGLVAQASIRMKITTGPFAPLAPVTLSKRKAKGFKGTKPLIETGQLRNAINYVVVPFGKA